MANFKRRSRRRDKRIMARCGCCEIDPKGERFPISHDDEICNGKPKRKKAGKKREKCPVNGAHDWVHELWVEHKTENFGKSGYWKCDDCTHDTWYHWDFCPVHLRVVEYTVRTKASLCLACGKFRQRVKKDRYYWRTNAHKELKKRPINLARGW